MAGGAELDFGSGCSSWGSSNRRNPFFMKLDKLYFLTCKNILRSKSRIKKSHARRECRHEKELFHNYRIR